MNIERFMKSARIGAKSAALRFARERKGVAAVEFAFIAPIMILLFVGTIELSAGISTNRKLSRVSSAIGDLITQSQSLTENDVQNIMNVSAKIMYPYKESVQIIVSGVRIENGQAEVAWSRSEPSGAEFATGTNYTVPSKIKKDGTFLVAAVISTNYTPSFGWAHYEKEKGVYFSRTPIPMREEIFLRPRIGSEVGLK